MTMFSYMCKMLHFFMDGRQLGVQNVGYEPASAPEFKVDALTRRLHGEQQGGGGGGDRTGKQ